MVVGAASFLEGRDRRPPKGPPAERGAGAGLVEPQALGEVRPSQRRGPEEATSPPTSSASALVLCSLSPRMGKKKKLHKVGPRVVP